MKSSGVLYLGVLSLSFLSTTYPVMADEWENCPPSIKGRDLDKWRKVLIEKVIEGKQREVKATVESCFPESAPACYEDLVHYADKKISPLPQFVPQTTEELVLKSEKDLPSEFLVKGADGKVKPGLVQIPGDIERIAEQKKWPSVLYKTRSTGGFDHSPNLYIVAISTPEKDIVLQTSPHEDASPSTSKDPMPRPSNGDFTNAKNTLTVITIDKTKTPPVGEMRRLNAAYNGNNKVSYTWNNDTGVITESWGDRCIACHNTPLKPISPLGYRAINENLENPMTKEHSDKVDAVNRVLEQYSAWGSKKVNGRLVKFGPPIEDFPLGWAPKESKTRTEEFLKNCATQYQNYPLRLRSLNRSYEQALKQNNPPQINYKRLGEAMNCVECHNNEKRGVLHETFSRQEVEFKIAGDKSMPHNIELNGDERLALISCLYAEKEAVKEDWRKSGDWMKRSSCFGDQFNGKPPRTIGSGSSERRGSSSSSSRQ